MSEWIPCPFAIRSGRIPSRAWRRWSGVLVLAISILAHVPANMDLARATPAHAAPANLAPPPFTGPTTGAPIVTAPLGTDFSYSCSVAANADTGHVAGTTLAPGAAVQGGDTCGYALLHLNAPSSGHFQAAFALADDAQAGSTGGLRIFVLGPNATTLRTLDVKAGKGAPRRVDVDVSGALTLAVSFLTNAASYVYSMQLTGTARALHATPLTRAGLPAGATPIAAKTITYNYDAAPAKQDDAVSHLTVPMTGSYELAHNGTLTVQLPPGAQGTLVVRYGAGDTYTYTKIPAQLSMRVRDAKGAVLRKAAGLTFSGSGLQPLWLDVRGGASVSIAADGASANAQIVVTGIGLLPGSYGPHPNPDHLTFGSNAGASVPIPASAVAGICNATLGTTDTTVGHRNIFSGDYVDITGCGVAEFIMTNTHGVFHASFGIGDDSGLKGDMQAIAVVLDKNSHPLRTVTVTAHYGQTGVPFSVSIENASILQIRTKSNGNVGGVLFGLALTGHAVLYDRVYPPSEPQASTAGGTPLPGGAFDVGCNAEVAGQDILLIHAAALEGWSIAGEGCGAASLDLTKIHGHTFSARYGIPALDDRGTITHLRISVLNAAGSIVRSRTFVARPGYGPQRLAIDLSGGARLRINWVDSYMVVYALTVA